MLAKSPKYFCDGEAVKQPSRGLPPRQFGRKDPAAHGREVLTGNMAEGAEWSDNGTANLRDVWVIAAEPLKAAHYAAFPTELVHRCLRAGTSAKGYCPACGAPWCRVVETTPVGTWHDHGADAHRGNRQEVERRNGSAYVDGYKPPVTSGWRPSCSCPPAEPRPGLVLDPFAGSGRTGVEALRLGLDFVGLELNPQYVAMARKILRDQFPLFASDP